MPQIPQSLFSDEEHAFWIAHGINYILSDWKNGSWTPMFPDIYDGTPVPLNQIAQTLVNSFTREGSPDWPTEAKVALAWAATTREVVYIYSLETQRRLKAKDPTVDASIVCKQPHNPIIWEVMNWMASQVQVKTI